MDLQKTINAPRQSGDVGLDNLRKFSGLHLRDKAATAYNIRRLRVAARVASTGSDPAGIHWGDRLKWTQSDPEVRMQELAGALWLLRVAGKAFEYYKAIVLGATFLDFHATYV